MSLINQLKIKSKQGLRLIGQGQPVFIIAEVSGNHNQSLAKAKKIIDAAANAKADAVKLQTYTADTITINCDNKYFQVNSNKDWKGQTLYSLYKKAYTPWAWQPQLKKYAEKKGLIFFSTPFDPTAVDFLQKLKVPLYKVASFEVVDIPLLKKIGQTKKPVIMSRGMASVADLKLALKTLKTAGCPQVAILHCLSAYPAKAEDMNLLTIPNLAKKLKVIPGLSDHSLAEQIPLTAVALGAKIIEKHLTLKRADGGPDASFSLEPAEFKKMVKDIRLVETAMGKASFKADKSEKENIVFRKSLFVVKSIKQGQKFTTLNTRCIRPGYGLHSKYFENVLCKKASKNIAVGTPLTWKLIKK